VAPKSQQREPLQVDIQRVLEAEGEKYAAMLAALVRENCILRTALDDQTALTEELQAKNLALGGMSAGPSQQPHGMHRPPHAPSGAATVGS
jgi:hypothetical protein